MLFTQKPVILSQQGEEQVETAMSIEPLLHFSETLNAPA